MNIKRNEEQKYREMNGFDEIEDMDFDEPKGHSLPIVGLFHCSNNKFIPDYITPRNRLLATHSSRLKAAKYREELKQQIEEKERLKAKEREKIRLEEELLESKLEEQRLKILKEYQNEERLLRKKAEELKIKEEMSEQIASQMSSSPLRLIRSPIYMPLKGQSVFSPSPKKNKSVSRSLASAMDQSMGRIQSTATQTSAQFKSGLTHREQSDSDSSSYASDDEEESEDQNQQKNRGN